MRRVQAPLDCLLPPRGREEIISYRGSKVFWLLRYQGNQWVAGLSLPLGSSITSGDLSRYLGGQSCAQGVGGAGDGQRAENSHLEGPDHTLHPCLPCKTLAILVCPSSVTPLRSDVQVAWKPVTTNARETEEKATPGFPNPEPPLWVGGNFWLIFQYSAPVICYFLHWTLEC